MKKLILPILVMLLLMSTVLAASYETTDRYGNPVKMFFPEKASITDIFHNMFGNLFAIYITPAAAVAGQKVSIAIGVETPYQPSVYCDYLKISMTKGGIMQDYWIYDITNSYCMGQSIGSWSTSFTAPYVPGTDYGIRYQVFDINKNVVFSEEKSFSVVTATPTTCPSPQSPSSWTLLSSSTNGKSERRDVYIKGVPPSCTEDSETEYRTICNSGYVCQGSTDQQCPGLKPCVSTAVIPPPSTQPEVCVLTDCTQCTFGVDSVSGFKGSCACVCKSNEVIPDTGIVDQTGTGAGTTTGTTTTDGTTYTTAGAKKTDGAAGTSSINIQSWWTSSTTTEKGIVGAAIIILLVILSKVFGRRY
jgi:hypothetical protein